MDVKKLLLDHFEKIALAVAGAIVLAFLIGTVLTESPAEAARNNVVDYNKRITAKAEIASKGAPAPSQPSAARDVNTALAALREPVALPPWLVHKRPVICTKTEGVEVPEPKHFAPTVEPPKGDLGMIGIRWTKNTADHEVKIDKYEVWRAEGDSAKESSWKKIHSTTDAAQQNFTDRDVKPKTDYFYQIWSYASVDFGDPAVDRAKKKGVDVILAASEVLQKSTIIGPIGTLPDVHLQVMNVVIKTTPAEIKQGIPERKPEAAVNVYKYFPEKKMWLYKLFTGIKVGEMIGRVETVGTEKLDFSTDEKLLATMIVRVKSGFGEVDADAIEVQDVKTGLKRIINSRELDPALQEIQKNPRPGDAGAPEEGDEKKPGSGKGTK